MAALYPPQSLSTQLVTDERFHVAAFAWRADSLATTRGRLEKVFGLSFK